MSNLIPDEAIKWASGDFLNTDDFRKGLTVKPTKPIRHEVSDFFDDNGNNQMINIYTFEVDGKEVEFKNGSKRLVNALKKAKVDVGMTLKIKCEGDGYATKWYVEQLEENLDSLRPEPQPQPQQTKSPDLESPQPPF